MTGYISATRHPWPSLIFLLPLLIVYEGGVLWLGGNDATTLRNGADAWLRWGLERYGLGQMWAAPLIILAVFITRSWISWRTRPEEPLATCFGMAIESIVFATGLWLIARNFEPFLKDWGIPAANVTFNTPATGQLVTYIGAGIYEEVLFRLGLFSIAYFILRLVFIPKLFAIVLSAVAAALIFAAAHHIGPHGEEVVTTRFLFRLVAGLYFTALYVLRGFGITVGAHAGYDILVGVAVG